eukprot:SAG25_NODE_613_length_6536_cov_28.178033_6_plen_88_part_00
MRSPHAGDLERPGSLSGQPAARVFSVLATDRESTPLLNFQAGMQQQPGILQPAEADSTSIGRRRFTSLSKGKGPRTLGAHTADSNAA